MPWLMLVICMLMGAAQADPLDEAASRYRALESYRVTLRSTAEGQTQHVLRYYYRQPGWVRMEFIQPHPGTVLIYDPGRQRVQVWPFGLGRRPTLSLDPDNRLIRGPRGHRIDRSDIGTLLAHLQELRGRGSLSPLGEASIFGRPAAGFSVTGEASEDGYRLWLAQDSLFPLRVERFRPDGGLIERVDLLDIELDLTLLDRFFTP